MLSLSSLSVLCVCQYTLARSASSSCGGCPCRVCPFSSVSASHTSSLYSPSLPFSPSSPPFPRRYLCRQREAASLDRLSTFREGKAGGEDGLHGGGKGSDVEHVYIKDLPKIEDVPQPPLK